MCVTSNERKFTTGQCAQPRCKGLLHAGGFSHMELPLGRVIHPFEFDLCLPFHLTPNLPFSTTLCLNKKQLSVPSISAIWPDTILSFIHHFVMLFQMQF